MRPARTEFFREDNIPELVAVHAGRLAAQNGGVIRVAQIGCSTGEETWSLASMLLQDAARRGGEYEFTIDAFDHDREALKYVFGPYPSRGILDEVSMMLRQRNGYPEACLEPLLQWSHANGRHVETQITLDPRMTSRVVFRSWDVLGEPLPPRQYQAVVINNVLPLYHEQERDKIFRNTLNGIEQNGIVALEKVMPHSTPEYRGWRRNLANTHELEPVSHPSVQPPTLLRRTQP